jgi:hypothetical protein
MPRSPAWRVLSSRDLFDASPFLKVRVETIELTDHGLSPGQAQCQRSPWRCFRDRLEFDTSRFESSLPSLACEIIFAC